LAVFYMFPIFECCRASIETEAKKKSSTTVVFFWNNYDFICNRRISLSEWVRHSFATDKVSGL